MQILVDVIKKDKVSSNKSKSIKKSDNQTIEISAKSKSQNLPKLKSQNLFMFQNI